MTTLAEFMILSGGDNRPPMLDKDLYDSWKSRMELYTENKEHGSLEDIPRLDTSKSNTYTLKTTSFKRRSTIKLKVPNVRRTYHLCATLTFKSKTVKFALTQQTAGEVTAANTKLLLLEEVTTASVKLLLLVHISTAQRLRRKTAK
ncbi:hypothetical protein Tco_0581491 [Tanacetum coccineum]